ncbi:hypothetical protein AAMO2058_000037900 [Amorphochlora amoebiformis]|mmetsp:Transcript_18301/g.29164  ORF Transcript_18301/g.29164 Transcript_18301/m.29164 type:complete len:236 (-) Transcript_18301:190-897(-)
MHPKVCARLFLLQLAMSWLEVSQAQMCSGECVCPTVCHEGNMYRTCPRDESDECRFVLHNIANVHFTKFNATSILYVFPGDNRDFVITGQGVLQFSGNIPPFSLDATGSISFLWRPTKPAGNFEFAIKKYHNSNKSKIAGLSKTTFIVVVVLGVGIGLIILARCLQKAGFKCFIRMPWERNWRNRTRIGFSERKFEKLDDEGEGGEVDFDERNNIQDPGEAESEMKRKFEEERLV